jgi:hypothetical protein
MSALTILVLELDLPIIAVIAFSAYSYLKGKFSPGVASQEVVAEALTYRQRSTAKSVRRLAA